MEHNALAYHSFKFLFKSLAKINKNAERTQLSLRLFTLVSAGIHCVATIHLSPPFYVRNNKSIIRLIKMQLIGIRINTKSS